MIVTRGVAPGPFCLPMLTDFTTPFGHDASADRAEAHAAGELRRLRPSSPSSMLEEWADRPHASQRGERRRPHASRTRTLGKSHPSQRIRADPVPTRRSPRRGRRWVGGERDLPLDSPAARRKTGRGRRRPARAGPAHHRQLCNVASCSFSCAPWRSASRRSANGAAATTTRAGSSTSASRESTVPSTTSATAGTSTAAIRLPTVWRLRRS